MLDNAIQFLNHNAGALTVVFTAVVTISTVVYAILTAILVVETKRMREVQTEPRIEITLRPFESAINIVRLHIKNIGYGPAENIKFKTSVLSGGEGAKKLLAEFTESNFFTMGLRYLGPSQEVYSHYSQINENYDQKVASILLFEMEYQSITGSQYGEKTVIDMSEMKGRYQLGTPDLYSIAQSLKKIQTDIEHITTGFKAVHANIYTHDDRERARKLRTERLEKSQGKAEKP